MIILIYKVEKEGEEEGKASEALKWELRKAVQVCEGCSQTQ